MIIEFKNVNSQHKLDNGQTQQKVHVTAKPISKLRKQSPSSFHSVCNELGRLLEPLQETLENH